MITVTVCVGSSCHIKGAREMIGRFNDFLTRERLEDRVELKGTFCMERCGEGINWKIDEETFSSSSVEEAVEVLRRKVQGLLRGKTT
ncbi:MAG: (2Fe-2S) ferredoxin domain-containing protein [Planctomycetota bacterium]|jgi:NADH:ubiquinone oxidoreductase subunit E